MIDFKTSKTKENLLKAFAGESQARNRYTFAAEVPKTEGYPILHDLFIYTANQEKAHAQQFMEKLKEFSGSEIEFTASYPVEVEKSTLTLLKQAEKNESNEGKNIYIEFAKVAKEEGFSDIENLFTNIASIENVHSERFKKYAEKLSSGSLFKDTITSAWMCTNCGFIYEGLVAPAKCPVCSHPQGYFIKFDESPFEDK